MKRRLFVQSAFLGLISSPAWAGGPLPKMIETPMLADQVKAGALPPVDQRLPQNPLVITRFPGGDGPGQPGGQINMLMANTRDTRLMTVYS
ncbi:hypothetical protein [Reyranella sp.]|uniref:hypothetical protein n=1 Tax=Reyranella sp. TaxID=1929291 RepID=UPI003784F6D3